MFYFDNTEKESVLLQPAIVDFEIMGFRTTKKNGLAYHNNGLMLTFIARDAAGNENKIFDLINTTKKTKYLLSSIGMSHLFEQGCFDPFELKNKKGKCEIIIKEDAAYGSVNSILKYIESPQETVKVAASHRPDENKDDDDVLPF